ncbi:MAG: hypothetical protein M5R42_12235 [Rhodocyclaceae bacterium]|nr:hypothetical protein [Rhodocyclaceae bacterium]
MTIPDGCRKISFPNRDRQERVMQIKAIWLAAAGAIGVVAGLRNSAAEPEAK